MVRCKSLMPVFFLFSIFLVALYIYLSTLPIEALSGYHILLLQCETTSRPREDEAGLTMSAQQNRYLKCIDKFFNNYISCFVTGGNVKFLLLHQPTTPTSTATSRSSTAIGANPTSPATEEAIKMFFTEVYDSWVKAIMNPFYKVNMEVQSSVFRARVAAAGRKYL